MLQRNRYRDTLNRRRLRLVLEPCSCFRLRRMVSRNQLQQIAMDGPGSGSYLRLAGSGQVVNGICSRVIKAVLRARCKPRESTQ
jgi:hypothetical protein